MFVDVKGISLVVVLDESDSNIDTRRNADVNNVLYNFNAGVKFNNSLVNTHLEVIPGLGTYSVKR